VLYKKLYYINITWLYSRCLSNKPTSTQYINYHSALLYDIWHQNVVQHLM